MNEGLKVDSGSFEDAAYQVELFCLGVVVPRLELDLGKVSVDGAIVGDNRGTKEDPLV